LEYKWTVLSVTTVGVLMSGLDSRIMIVGLPQIATALHASAEQAVWFTQSYVFGSTLMLLLIGKITDAAGRVKIYNTGFVIFTVGSLLTSLSPGPNEVILFRAIQGFGSAMLSVNSAALIVDVAEKKNLGLMLGLNSLAFRGGAVVGLTVSGLILSLVDWRALFYINIPIGIFGTYWAHRRLKETVTIQSGLAFDWIGFATFTVAMGCLLLALTYSAYGFASLSVTDSLFVLSVASFAAFVIQERRSANPMFDPGLLRIRQFTGGSLAQFLNAISWGAVLVLLSLYFQLVRGLSTLQTGIMLVPFELAYMLTGPLSGRLSDRHGRIWFTVFGLAVQGFAVYLFSTLTDSTSFYNAASYMALFGVGSGLFNSPISSSIMESVPKERRGIASATSSTFWNVGYTISLSLAVVIMTTVVPYSVISGLISSVTISPSAIDRTLFDEGVRQTYLWLAALDFVAILPSALRGERSNVQSEGSRG
jgi:EmrB/QacA subfamily drug resistance transporter